MKSNASPDKQPSAERLQCTPHFRNTATDPDIRRDKGRCGRCLRSTLCRCPGRAARETNIQSRGNLQPSQQSYQVSSARPLLKSQTKANRSSHTSDRHLGGEVQTSCGSTPNCHLRITSVPEARAHPSKWGCGPGSQTGRASVTQMPTLPAWLILHVGTDNAFEAGTALTG